ncbi:MAG TPA: type IV pilus twitching motility protein PilT [Gammaproteobacteria bacterium]
MASRIDAFLELVAKQGGSDLHLVAGNPPRLRLYGDVIAIKYRELSSAETESFLYEIMPESLHAEFERRNGLDFAYSVPDLARFRVNVFRHLGGMGAVFRVVPHRVPELGQLGLPPAVPAFCRHKQGLVLVTGPTGAGKSTTLAAMIGHLNANLRGHVITVEDPIEFLHTRDQCLISQREIGFHTPSFPAALRSALREDPDVIMIGELRDYESISLALTAAETGVLVFATLHTSDAASTVDRLINAFPAAEQPRVRLMLASSLVGVISQQLVRRSDGRGRVAAIEVLVNNPAAANLIREGKPEQLANVIQSGGLQGMQSMDTALRRLLDARLVDGAAVYRLAANKQAFQQHAEADA